MSKKQKIESELSRLTNPGSWFEDIPPHEDDAQDTEKLQFLLDQIKAEIFRRDKEYSDRFEDKKTQPIEGTTSTIRLNPKKQKIDLLRVFDALWELGFFIEEGTTARPSRKALLEAIGGVLHEKFSNADNLLSVAYSYGEKPEELNVQIFIEMADAMRDKVDKKLKRKK